MERPCSPSASPGSWSWPCDQTHPTTKRCSGSSSPIRSTAAAGLRQASCQEFEDPPVGRDLVGQGRYAMALVLEDHQLGAGRPRDLDAFLHRHPRIVAAVDHEQGDLDRAGAMNRADLAQKVRLRAVRVAVLADPEHTSPWRHVLEERMPVGLSADVQAD